MRRAATMMTSLLVMSPACGLFGTAASSWPLPRLAAHSTFTHTWHESVCERSGTDCDTELAVVAIESAESSDPDVVETSIALGAVFLTTHEPGEAVIRLEGEGQARDLIVEVAEIDAFVFPERCVVDQHALLLPGARAVFGLRIQDAEGEALDGVPQLEISGIPGAEVELLPSIRGLAVTAPAALGRFEVGIEEHGTIFTVDVIDEGEIDGVTSSEYLAAPTRNGHMLAAGDVHAEITLEDPSCALVVGDWGIAPPSSTPRSYVGQGDEAETWLLWAHPRTGDKACDVRIDLPLANDGAGLQSVISY